MQHHPGGLGSQVEFSHDFFPGKALGMASLLPTIVIRWDEKAGLRRDAVGSQIIDVLEAQEIKETGNEEG